MTKIFIAYSRKDVTLLQELRAHLAILERAKLARIWYDGEIEAGSNWEESIKNAMFEANLVLMLISPDFIASDYCYNVEMSRAISLHDQRSLKIIPVILRPCNWHLSPLGRIQALPQNGLPITEWDSSDKAFTLIVDRIANSLKEIEREKDALDKQQRAVDAYVDVALSQANQIGDFENTRAAKALFEQLANEGFTESAYYGFRTWVLNKLRSGSYHHFYNDLLAHLGKDNQDIAELLDGARVSLSLLAEQESLFEKALEKQLRSRVHESTDQEQIEKARTTIERVQTEFTKVLAAIRGQLLFQCLFE
ncbi:MAG: toll/interleukin-1 receptor domain-containing protein [Bacteroidota bacterium]